MEALKSYMKYNDMVCLEVDRKLDEKSVQTWTDQMNKLYDWPTISVMVQTGPYDTVIV